MRLRVLSPATAEIAAAAGWFDAQRNGLGSEFWTSVEEVLAQIEADPQRFAKSEFATPDIDLRFALVRRFKYVIHFAIEEEEVQVVAVAHGARRPGYWRRRAKD